jgi:FixJ family two-component response regulator
MDYLRNCYQSLTDREREIFRLVVQGKLNKQIGAQLGIAERTVKAHRAQVMEKMEVGSLADLVRVAGELHLETEVV